MSISDDTQVIALMLGWKSLQPLIMPLISAGHTHTLVYMWHTLFFTSNLSYYYKILMLNDSSKCCYEYLLVQHALPYAQ